MKSTILLSHRGGTSTGTVFPHGTPASLTLGPKSRVTYWTHRRIEGNLSQRNRHFTFIFVLDGVF